MSNRIVSIQVVATIDRKLGQGESQFEMTSADCPDKTHWSVYTRNEGGDCDHVEDYIVGVFLPSSVAKNRALVHAAEISMEHSAFIEKIK